jgi:fructose 1,6-bisphosphatase
MQVVQAWLQEQLTNSFAYGIRKFGPRINEITVRNRKVETLLPFSITFHESSAFTS